MAIQNPPSFLQNVATETAAEARNLVLGLLGGTANGGMSAGNGGVVGSGDLAVSQHSTGNMSVDVAGGACFILGTQNSTQGVYHCWGDSTAVNLVISASDPTNPRIDTVVARVEDAFYSGSNNDWNLAVIAGTATSGATLVNLTGKGSVPANAIVLAYVLVPATATSILTADLLDSRPFIQRPETYTPSVAGPPTSGAHVIGDEVVDKWGALWRCITAGTPGTFIYAGGGRYTARMAYTLAGSLGSGAVVPFDTVTFDPQSACTTGASAKYTVQVAGKYLINGRIRANAGYGGNTQLQQNGGVVENGNILSTATTLSSQFFDIVQCAAGDTLQLVVSSAVTLAGASGDNWLTISLISS